MGSGDWFKTIISKKKSKRAKSKNAKVPHHHHFFFLSHPREEKKDSLSTPISKSLMDVLYTSLPCMPSKQPEKGCYSFCFIIKNGRDKWASNHLSQLGVLLLCLC